MEIIRKSLRAEDMKRGFCGKDCEICSYYDPCAGCWNRMCLLARCLRGTTFEGITNPRPFCTYRKICHVVEAEIKSAPLPTIKESFKQDKIDLPSFIPIIEIGNHNSWFWSDIKKTIIIIRLGEILTNNKLKNQICKKGLHEYLNFDGHIMLSTIMQDELLDHLTISELKVLIKDLQPDSCMIPDCYTYLDDPQLMSWQQLSKMFNQTQELLDQEIPIIGLVKGASRIQISYCTKQLLKIGITTFVFPARELAETGLLEPLILNLLNILKKNKADVHVIIYGLSYPMYNFSWDNISYASMSWYIDAKHTYYYWNKLRYPVGHTAIRFNTCNCLGCKKRIAYEVASYQKDLAIHNLITLEKRFSFTRRNNG